MSYRSQSAFTLAELLIALAILGVIATFTIPKVLNSQQNTSYKAIAKENIAMLSGAYRQYTLENGASTTIGIRDLTPYMNYVTIDTSGVQVDDDQISTTEDCTAAFPCLRLHNGSTLAFREADSFDTTDSTAAVWAHIDPDGKVSSNKALAIFLYYNGLVTDEGNIRPNTRGALNPDPAKVPTWFNW